MVLGVSASFIHHPHHRYTATSMETMPTGHDKRTRGISFCGTSPILPFLFSFSFWKKGWRCSLECKEFIVAPYRVRLGRISWRWKRTHSRYAFPYHMHM